MTLALCRFLNRLMMGEREVNPQTKMDDCENTNQAICVSLVLVLGGPLKRMTEMHTHNNTNLWNLVFVRNGGFQRLDQA